MPHSNSFYSLRMISKFITAYIIQAKKKLTFPRLCPKSKRHYFSFSSVLDVVYLLLESIMSINIDLLGFPGKVLSL